MNTIELQFPVLGESLPINHGYPLYATLARRIPALHDDQAAFSIGPIRGDLAGRGMLRPNRRSRLRLRLPADTIGTFLLLAGQPIEVGGYKLRLGVPSVQAPIPAAALTARLVAMKIHGTVEPTPEQFLDAVHRRLAEHAVSGQVSLPAVRYGPHAGRPGRRVLRIKGCALVGYALRITQLSPDDSLRLQCDSPFGRRRMGCGFFVPTQEEEG